MIRLNSHRCRANRLLELRFAEREADLRTRLQNEVTRVDSLQKFKEATSMDDDTLVEELLSQKFRCSNVPALDYFPLAKVAWASGEVTPYEYTTAIRCVEGTVLAENIHAFWLFTTWLRYRPDGELWSIWQRVTRAKLRHLSAEERLDYYNSLSERARRIALESGGVLGFGKICRAERRVLDVIDNICDS